jgi:glycosyltransferase involved in cell wall biosynthesis
VTVVNATNTGGGAADAARGIYTALRRHSKLDARMLVGVREGDDPNVAAILGPGKHLAQRLIRKAAVEPTIGQDYWLPFSSAIENHSFVRDADVLNFHNIHGGYFPYPLLARLARHRRIVISMQDNWYLTGHCSSFDDCDGWRRRCTPCPHLHFYPRLAHDNAGFHWRRKFAVYRDAGAVFVSCSQWLQELARSSPLFDGLEVHHIPNPVDLEAIQPAPSEPARQLLRLPTDRRIVCFGAADVGDRRKGLRAFVRQLPPEMCRDLHLLFLLMGRDPSGFIEALPAHVDHRFLGAVDSPALRAIAYAASDVLILPTLADNLPNMLLEALAAGLPSIAFDVGGCREAVVPNTTGELCRAGDYTTFVSLLAGLLADTDRRRRLSAAARRLAEDAFSPQRCARDYERVLGGNSSRAPLSSNTE